MFSQDDEQHFKLVHCQFRFGSVTIFFYVSIYVIYDNLYNVYYFYVKCYKMSGNNESATVDVIKFEIIPCNTC